MDSEEFAELQAYERYFEPIGDARDDLRAALVAYHTGTAFCGSRGKTIRDFSLHFKPPTFEEADPAERELAIRDKMATWRQSHNSALGKPNGNNRKSGR